MSNVAPRVAAFLFTMFFAVNYSFASEMKSVTYEKDIKKVVEVWCLDCHGSDAPTMEEYVKDREKYHELGKYPRVDTYEYLMVFINGEHIGALTKRLDDGKAREDHAQGSMYVYLGNTEDLRQANLKLFKDWIGNWVPKAIHEIKEEMESDWLSSVLEGTSDGEGETQSVDDILDDIRKDITAPEK